MNMHLDIPEGTWRDFYEGGAGRIKRLLADSTKHAG